MACKNYWDKLGANDDVELTGSFEIRGKIPEAFRKEVVNRRMKAEANKAEGSKFTPPKSKTTTIHTASGNTFELRDKTVTPKDTVPMGGSENPLFQNTVLPRAFRFLIESPTHPKLAYYIKKMDVYYVGKKLMLEIYDTVDAVGFNWIMDTGNVLKQIMLDGCGRTLYTVTYKHLKLTDHKLSCDYSDSSLPIHHCMLTFEEMTRV